MTLYRFTQDQYSHDISGEGARLFGGRWNSKGNAVVYTSTAISLALLELLVHCSNYNDMNSNVLVSINVPGIFPDDIPRATPAKNWQTDIDYCRYIGDTFLASRGSLLLKVPSAIIPGEYNVLINPSHYYFKKIVIGEAAPFLFDPRLFKK